MPETQNSQLKSITLKPIVFKLGGEALISEAALADFLQQVKKLQTIRPVVIVHGGGPQVETIMQSVGLKSVKVDGMRATPLEHLPFVVAALAGMASQQLLAACHAQNVKALALSLADADLFKAKAKSAQLGAVGEVQANNPQAIEILLAQQYTVLLSSIGCDDLGQSLNINADDAAVAAAQLLNADLCLLSNVPGVLNAEKDLIKQLNRDDIDRLISEQVITDGMVVKVNAAYEAALKLQNPVHIGNWQDAQALNDLVETGELHLGTKITV